MFCSVRKNGARRWTAGSCQPYVQPLAPWRPENPAIESATRIAAGGTSLRSNPTAAVEGENKAQATIDAAPEDLWGPIASARDLVRQFFDDLNIGANTDRNQTLGGDASARALQSAMMNLITASANGTSSSVRTLADLGIQTQSDGTLSLEAPGVDVADAWFAPLVPERIAAAAFVGVVHRTAQIDQRNGTRHH